MSAFAAANFTFDRASFRRLPISLQRLWIGLLAGASIVATGAFACAAPFAAVAALAAATLSLRQALAVTAALWLGNQIVGYSVLGYPTDGATLIWGLIMMAASLAATFVAHRSGRVLPEKPALLRLTALFIAALATYEAGLLLGALIVPDNGAFAPDIVAYVAFVDATWAIGLGAAYIGLQTLAGITAVTRQRRQA